MKKVNYTAEKQQEKLPPRGKITGSPLDITALIIVGFIIIGSLASLVLYALN